MTVKIAIDCMGGDHGPKVTVAAALSFAAEFPGAALSLVGHADRLEERLRRAAPEKAIRDRLTV
ncbi:MAG: phosphate acyltransferase, partial [Fluviibacter sp.]